MTKTKKHIAILHFAYPPNIGGVEILMQEHANILTKEGYQVTIVTGSGKSNNPDVSVIEVAQLQSIMNFNQKLQDDIFAGTFTEEFETLTSDIKTILEKILPQFDTIIIHNMMTVSRNLAFTKAFKEYAQDSNQNIIIYIHDHMYVKGNGLNMGAKRSNIEEQLITEQVPNATYIAISEVLKEQLLKVIKIKSDKLHVIPNGLEIQSFLELDTQIQKLITKKRILSRFPIILSPVNIIPRKNLLYSLEILHELKKTYPDVLYIISGDISKHYASEEYLKKMKFVIAKYELDRNVLFLKDFIERILKTSEMHDLYSIADAVFFFSESENFGLPILEAGLMRRPVFVSDLKIFDEVGKSFITKIDTNSTDYASVSTTITKSLQQNESQLFYRIRSQYDLDVIVKKHLIPLV